MAGVRIRTKFLLSVLLTSVCLTCASLLVVRHSVEQHVREDISSDMRSSLVIFQNVQRQREADLSRSAELLANLPTLKALMTTDDAATIQDASQDIWRLSGSSLLVLADRTGRVVGLHTSRPGFPRELAQSSLGETLAGRDASDWWFGAGHLYEVFVQPIYFGAVGHSTALGALAVGYEVDEQAATEIASVAGSQVAFQYGETIAITTLSPAQQTALMTRNGLSAAQEQSEIELGKEKFLSSSVELSPVSSRIPVRLLVLKSYDQATKFLQRLNRLLIVLGITTVLIGGLLVLGISNTFTRSLKDLVAGVRSLERGDYSYPLPPQEAGGSGEVAEVTGAFLRMRRTLHTTQQQLLAAERLATIGTMASSISHDLRHALTAVLANAEFLCDRRIDARQRQDLYQEIRVAVDQMTDLIDSLVEFSRTRECLHASFSSIETAIHNAANAVRAHPEFHEVRIVVSSENSVSCWMDAKKIERAFYNLLLNACHAVDPQMGTVTVGISSESNRCLVIRVADNGHGIAPEIRDNVFEPFTSFGKENGSGLGLAVVQKIVQDHNGTVDVESTSSAGTVFRLILPIRPPAPVVPDATGEQVHAPPKAA